MHVADDHGDPWTARLQGRQTSHRRTARHRAGDDPFRLAAAEWPAVLVEALVAHSVALAVLVMFSAAGWVACFAGGAAGSIISGGLGDLLKQFQQNGHGDTATLGQPRTGTSRSRPAISPMRSAPIRSTA